jgi:hypothetical protein
LPVGVICEYGVKGIHFILFFSTFLFVFTLRRYHLVEFELKREEKQSSIQRIDIKDDCYYYYYYYCLVVISCCDFDE